MLKRAFSGYEVTVFFQTIGFFLTVHLSTVMYHSALYCHCLFTQCTILSPGGSDIVQVMQVNSLQLSSHSIKTGTECYASEGQFVIQFHNPLSPLRCHLQAWH
jgi:hypothetical protein